MSKGRHKGQLALGLVKSSLLSHHMMAVWQLGQSLAAAAIPSGVRGAELPSVLFVEVSVPSSAQHKEDLTFLHEVVLC
jgi:hypothetical protein